MLSLFYYSSFFIGIGVLVHGVVVVLKGLEFGVLLLRVLIHGEIGLNMFLELGLLLLEKYFLWEFKGVELYSELSDIYEKCY